MAIAVGRWLFHVGGEGGADFAAGLTIVNKVFIYTFTIILHDNFRLAKVSIVLSLGFWVRAVFGRVGTTPL